MGSSNERRHYTVTPPRIGRAHAQKNPWYVVMNQAKIYMWKNSGKCVLRYRHRMITHHVWRMRDILEVSGIILGMGSANESSVIIYCLRFNEVYVYCLFACFCFLVLFLGCVVGCQLTSPIFSRVTASALGQSSVCFVVFLLVFFLFFLLIKLPKKRGQIYHISRLRKMIQNINKIKNDKIVNIF